MDLRDLRRDHEPGDLEQLVGAHLAVAEDPIGPGRIPEARVAVGRGGGLLAERVHEEVVLAREDGVEDAQSHGPVVRKRRRLLAGPQRVGGIAGLEHGQVPEPLPGARARADGPAAASLAGSVASRLTRRRETSSWP